MTHKQYPIIVRITIDSEQVQFNSQLMVGKDVKGQWHSRLLCDGDVSAHADRENQDRPYRIYKKEIENNRYFSPLKLKNIYLGIDTKAYTLLTVF